MGSPEDFAAMLNFVNEHKIEPVIDEVFAFAQAKQAIERMGNSLQFGKLVLHM